MISPPGSESNTPEMWYSPISVPISAKPTCRSRSSSDADEADRLVLEPHRGARNEQHHEDQPSGRCIRPARTRPHARRVTRCFGGAANSASRCSTGTTRSANRRMFNSPSSCGMPP